MKNYKMQKNARERYQNSTEEEKEKRDQYHHEPNKNHSKTEAS